MMNALVLQSDFGLEDGAVSAMKGVAHNVSKVISIYDNTHDIPPFDIWLDLIGCCKLLLIGRREPCSYL